MGDPLVVEAKRACGNADSAASELILQTANLKSAEGEVKAATKRIAELKEAGKSLVAGLAPAKAAEHAELERLESAKDVEVQKLVALDKDLSLLKTKLSQAVQMAEAKLKATRDAIESQRKIAATTARQRVNEVVKAENSENDSDEGDSATGSTGGTGATGATGAAGRKRRSRVSQDGPQEANTADPFDTLLNFDDKAAVQMRNLIKSGDLRFKMNDILSGVDSPGATGGIPGMVQNTGLNQMPPYEKSLAKEASDPKAADTMLDEVSKYMEDEQERFMRGLGDLVHLHDVKKITTRRADDAALEALNKLSKSLDKTRTDLRHFQLLNRAVGLSRVETMVLKLQKIAAAEKALRKAMGAARIIKVIKPAQLRVMDEDAKAIEGQVLRAESAMAPQDDFAKDATHIRRAKLYTALRKLAGTIRSDRVHIEGSHGNLSGTIAGLASQMAVFATGPDGSETTVQGASAKLMTDIGTLVQSFSKHVGGKGKFVSTANFTGPVLDDVKDLHKLQLLLQNEKRLDIEEAGLSEQARLDKYANTGGAAMWAGEEPTLTTNKERLLSEALGNLNNATDARLAVYGNASSGPTGPAAVPAASDVVKDSAKVAQQAAATSKGLKALSSGSGPTAAVKSVMGDLSQSGVAQVGVLSKMQMLGDKKAAKSAQNLATTLLGGLKKLGTAASGSSPNQDDISSATTSMMNTVAEMIKNAESLPGDSETKSAIVAVAKGLTKTMEDLKNKAKVLVAKDATKEVNAAAKKVLDDKGELDGDLNKAETDLATVADKQAVSTKAAEKVAQLAKELDAEEKLTAKATGRAKEEIAILKQQVAEGGAGAAAKKDELAKATTKLSNLEDKVAVKKSALAKAETAKTSAEASVEDTRVKAMEDLHSAEKAAEATKEANGVLEGLKEKMVLARGGSNTTEPTLGEATQAAVGATAIAALADAEEKETEAAAEVLETSLWHATVELTLSGLSGESFVGDKAIIRKKLALYVGVSPSKVHLSIEGNTAAGERHRFVGHASLTIKVVIDTKSEATTKNIVLLLKALSKDEGFFNGLKKFLPSITSVDMLSAPSVHQRSPAAQAQNLVSQAQQNEATAEKALESAKAAKRMSEQEVQLAMAGAISATKIIAHLKKMRMEPDISDARRARLAGAITNAVTSLDRYKQKVTQAGKDAELSRRAMAEGTALLMKRDGELAEAATEEQVSEDAVMKAKRDALVASLERPDVTEEMKVEIQTKLNDLESLNQKEQLKRSLLAATEEEKVDRELGNVAGADAAKGKRELLLDTSKAMEDLLDVQAAPTGATGATGATGPAPGATGPKGTTKSPEQAIADAANLATRDSDVASTIASTTAAKKDAHGIPIGMPAREKKKLSQEAEAAMAIVEKAIAASSRSLATATSSASRTRSTADLGVLTTAKDALSNLDGIGNAVSMLDRQADLDEALSKKTGPEGGSVLDRIESEQAAQDLRACRDAMSQPGLRKTFSTSVVIAQEELREATEMVTETKNKLSTVRLTTEKARLTKLLIEFEKMARKARRMLGFVKAKGTEHPGLNVPTSAELASAADSMMSKAIIIDASATGMTGGATGMTGGATGMTGATGATGAKINVKFKNHKLA